MVEEDSNLNQIGVIGEDSESTRVYDTSLARTIKNGGGMGAKTGLYLVDQDSPRIAGWHENENVIAAHRDDEKRSTVSEEVYHKNADNQPWISTKQRIRRLTPRECFRLQGFPDSFDISKVSDSQAYKQAGNSITTNVLREIFRKLLIP